MAKKKALVKRVEIKLPVPHDCPAPEEVVVVPVLHDFDEVVPLPAAVGPIRCVLTLKETFWQGTQYIVLSAAEGSLLPEHLKTGMEVDIQFLPPTNGGV